MPISMEFQPGARPALSGIWVLDLSRLVAGNTLTHLLANHGDEVIKVERPGIGETSSRSRPETALSERSRAR